MGFLPTAQSLPRSLKMQFFGMPLLGQTVPDTLGSNGRLEKLVHVSNSLISGECHVLDNWEDAHR